MVRDPFDYSDHIEKPDTVAFKRINELIERQAAAAELVAKKEEELSAAVDNFKQLSENDLPDLMEELNIGSPFTSGTGLVVDVKEYVRANITEENAAIAHKWLRDNGEGGIIKNTVKVEFSRKEDKKAVALIQELLKRGCDVSNKRAVHAATLSKWVRDRIAAGLDVPESVTVFRQKVAKITA